MILVDLPMKSVLHGQIARILWGARRFWFKTTQKNTSYSWLVEPKSFGASRDQLPVGVYKVKVNQDNCVDTLSVRIKGDDSYPKARFEVFPEANGLLFEKYLSLCRFLLLGFGVWGKFLGTKPNDQSCQYTPRIFNASESP